MKLASFIIAILASLLLAVQATAQVNQPGVVLEYKGVAAKTAVADAELLVSNAQSAISGKDGKFTLTFRNDANGKPAKAGNPVTLRKVIKPGYEIFNKQAIEQWTISPSVPFQVHLVRSDKFRELCDTYYGNASTSYRNQREKDRARIESLKKENKLKEQEYYRQIEEIENRYAKQLEELDQYVDKFARIDLSEINETEKEIIALIQEGRMEEAIDKYRSLDLLNKQLKQLEKREILEQEKAYNDSDIESGYAALERQIDALKLVGGREANEEIATIYRTIADNDTTNVNWLLAAGKYISDYLDDTNLSYIYYNQALSEVTKTNDNIISTAKVYISIAGQCTREKNYEQASSYYEKALDICKNSLDECDITVARCYNNWGKMYFTQGKNDLALEKYLKSYNILIQLETENIRFNKSMLANVLMNIGVMYNLNSEFDKAKSYYLQAQNILEKNAPNSREMAMIYNNLGVLYRNLKDYKQSIFYMLKGLSIRQSILPEHHSDIALSYYNIADVFHLQGDLENALAYSEKSLDVLFMSGHYNFEIAKINLTDFIRDYLTNATNAKHKISTEIIELILNYSKKSEYEPKICFWISSYYFESNIYDKAIEYATKSIELFEKKRIDISDEYEYTLDFYILGNSLMENNLYTQAIESFHIFFDIADYRTKISQFYRHALSRMGKCYDEIGDYQNAAKYYDDALEITRKCVGENNIETAQIYCLIGDLAYNLDDYNKSLNYYKSALSIKLDALGIDNKEVSYLYKFIGHSLFGLSDYPQAIENYLNSLKITYNLLDSTYLDFYYQYLYLGNSYFCLYDYQNALENFKQALTIVETNLGNNDSTISNCRIKIGDVYSATEEYEHALENYKKALEIKLSQTETNKSDFADIYTKIAQTLHLESRNNEATEYFLKAYECNHEYFGTPSLEVTSSLYLLGNNYYLQKDYENALNSYIQSLQIIHTDLFDSEINGYAASLIFNYMAYCSMYLKRYDDAINYVNQAIHFGPTDPNIYDSKAEILLNVGRREEAIATLGQIHEFDPAFDISTLPSFRMIYVPE